MSSRPQVIQLKKENPQYTLQQIGDQIGITRERVRQILNTESLPTHHLTPPKRCRQCKKPINKAGNRIFCSLACKSLSRRIKLVCETCHIEFYRLKGINNFRTEKTGLKHQYCCLGCFLAVHRITLICSSCLNPFTLPKSYFQARVGYNYYCTKKCRSSARNLK